MTTPSHEAISTLPIDASEQMPESSCPGCAARRQLLTTAASLMGGGAVVAAAVPFLASMKPSARAEAAGAPVEVDFSSLKPGEMITVEWRGKPIYVLHRSPEQMAELAKGDANLRDPESAVKTQQPPYAQNETRSLRPEIGVMVGICTHLGCAPTFRPDAGAADMGANWPGGFFCPCHGSRFDLAGRVYAGVPAPTNLEVPPYRFLSDTRLLIGEDPEST